MKSIFLDTEFTSLTQSAQLISLALVSDCGKNFYAEFNDYDIEKCTDFVKEHVVSQIGLGEVHGDFNNFRIVGNKVEIKNALLKWLEPFNKIQFWADVPHYDWVLFCELFGGSFNLPQSFDYMVMDLATLLESKNMDIHKSRIALLSPQEIPENYIQHNALSDAQVGMKILKKLTH